MDSLAFTPALTQAQMIRDRRISPLELVEMYLKRIETLNPQLGCFFHVAAENARQEAATKTEQLAQIEDPSQLPPFFGVPISIKDLNAVAGMPCSYGVFALKDNIPNYEDAVVTRIKQAGFIILGKTATSQLGSFPYTEPPGFAPTCNPWNMDYTAGGSSGGAACAVAAGLGALAQGSDGGGSVRGPALCCGLVGIKPSRGRVSQAPVGDYQSGIATNGPLGRTVADAAALLDVMSGYITGDPYWLPDPEISFLEATRQPLPRLKIAFSTGLSFFGEATPSYQKAVHETAQRLEEMGHILEEGCFSIDGLVEPFTRIWQAGVPASGIPVELLCSMNQWLGEQAGSAGDYLRAVKAMQIVSRQIVAFFGQYDALVLPVYLHSPIKIGAWENLPPSETLEKIINWVAPCPPCNASGLPAITVPTGFDEEGLPVGVQLIGPPADEMTLIALAAQLETVHPWSHHYPPIRVKRETTG